MTSHRSRGARYEAMFRRLDAAKETAFIPFTVLGDPAPAACRDVLRVLVESGADALELGIPFSDPVADGPTIQAAAGRALAAGVRPADCWELIAGVRREAPALPIGVLVYANLIVRPGIEAFYRSAAAAGVDSVLVADLPVAEAAPFREAAAAHGIASVYIAPPNAAPATLDRLAAWSEGYTYVVTRAGVTGADQHLQEDSARQVAELRRRDAAPPVHGFGIATPEHVRTSRRMGAAGAIAGSAIVAHVARVAHDAGAFHQLTTFVRAMKNATREPPS